MKTLNLTFNEGVLLAISTLTVLAGATIAPSLPFIAEQFSQITHNTFWAQLAIGLPGICVALSAAWIGKNAAGKNTPILLIIALLGYGVLGVAYLIAPEKLSLLLASRAVLGFCVAAIMIMTTVLLVKDKAPQKSAQLLGYQAAAGGFGGVIYMALANELTQWYGLAPFGLYAIAWLFAVLLWLSFPKSLQQDRQNNLVHASNNLKTTKKDASNKNTGVQNAALNTPRFLLFGLLATIEMLSLYALVLQVPLLEFATPYVLSAGLTCSLLAMSITAAFYGRIQRIFNQPNQHIAGLLIIALGFVALALGIANINVLALILVLCVMGIGFGLLRPNLVAWVFSTIFVSERHSAMGKLTAVFFSAQFIAPLIVYPLVRFAGLQTLWLCFAGICGLASAYLIISTMQTKQSGSTSAELAKG